MANNKIYSDYLMHYRTKGSRNGYSKDPNYTPVGKKAMDPLDYDSRKDDPDYYDRGRYFDDDTSQWRNNYDLTGKAKFKMFASSVAENLPGRNNPIRKAANAVRESKRAEERSKQQDASIDTNRKRIQQARADREYANRTRYSQQEAIEATKAGHGKAPTNGKSGRLTAGFATADAASSAAKAGIDGRDNAFRERAIARVKADAMGRNASDMAKKSKVAYYHNELEKSKKISDKRNSRSDIGNAIADAKSDAKRFGKKVRNVSDFVVEDTADRAKKLVNKGKKKVSKLLKKFR